MAEQIKIAELNIDDKALLKSLTDTKKAIVDLTAAQKDMKGTSDETSESFVQNEVKLKNLKAEYNKQVKILQTTTTAQAKLTAELNKENKSVDEATANNKALKLIRNQLNSSTVEGAKAIADINSKLDTNTAYIKDNISSLEKQKTEIGAYTSGIQKAKLGAVAFGTALKAAGIGLIVAGIAKLTSVFSENQKVMNFVNTAGRVFTIVMNDLVSFFVDNTGKVTQFFKATFSDPQASIKKLGDLIKSNIIERFESMLDTVGYVGSAFKKLVNRDFEGAMADAKSAGKELVDVMTGVPDTFDKVSEGVSSAVDSISKYGKEVLATADAQIKLENSVKLAEAQNKRLLEQYDRQAEKLRQIRDDETKTFEERIAANNKLSETLNEQEKLMTRNADLAIQEAQNNLALNNTIENRVALTEALTEKDAILAAIEGKRSEQIVNRVALNKEEAESEQAKFDRINEIREGFLLSEEEAAIAKIEREAEAHEAEIVRLVENETVKADLLKAIEEQKIADIQAIKDKGAEDEAVKRDKELENELNERQRAANARLAIVSTLGSALAGLAKENSTLAKVGLIVEKGAAIAGIIANTALANAKAVAASPLTFGQPFVTANTVAGAAGIASVAAQTVDSFGKGGVLNGPSHENGGIKTPFGELEGGEAVINTESTAKYRPLLSAINVAGGGKKFASGGVLGDASSPTSDLIDYSRLAEVMANLPAPVVAVEEIQRVGNRAVSVQQSASF